MREKQSKGSADSSGAGLATASLGKTSRSAKRYAGVPGPAGAEPETPGPGNGGGGSGEPSQASDIDMWQGMLEQAAQAEQTRLPAKALKRARRRNKYWLPHHKLTPPDYGFGASEPGNERFAYYVSELQEENGLEVDGIAGPKTAAKFCSGKLNAKQKESAAKKKPGSEAKADEISQAPAPSAPTTEPGGPSQNTTPPAPPAPPAPTGDQAQQPTPAAPTPVGPTQKTIPTAPVEQQQTTTADASVPTDVPDHSELAQYVASLGNAEASSAMTKLTELETFIASHKGEGNYHARGAIGQWRRHAVARIRDLRAQVIALDGSGLDPNVLARVKAGLFRAIQNATPSYSQGKNIDLLESAGAGTRTCNVTSIAMALESMGKTANDYDPAMRQSVVAVAKSFSKIVGRAKDAVGKAGAKDFEQLTNLRLSDFLQLAAVAEYLGPGGDGNVQKAKALARKGIVNRRFLVKLPGRFGATVETKALTVERKGKQVSKAGSLRAFGLRENAAGKNRRKRLEPVVDAREKMEAAEGTKGYERAKKRYERLRRGQRKSLESKSGPGLSVDEYKQSVIDQVGARLDTGAAIFINLANHYVRLQAIHEDHVVVDDPGRRERADRKVLWEEARVLGYFAYWYPMS